MKRPVWALSGFGLLVAVVSVLLYQANRAPDQPRLRSENFSLIREGMTRAEVEELLGGPPGRYDRRVGGHYICTGLLLKGPLIAAQYEWSNETDKFLVLFDSKDLVVGTHRVNPDKWIPPEGFFAKIWRLLTDPFKPRITTT